MLYYCVENRRTRITVQAIFITMIVAVSSLYLLRPVVDNDFFWHLKTGEWIWQHQALPAEDPFAYTTPHIHSDREDFLLTSYWLSQVLLYLAYLAGGIPGIVLSRFILAGMLVFVMSKRKEGDRIVYSCLLILFLINFLTYPVERPHFFSFLFFSLLLYFLERFRNEEIQSSGKGMSVSLSLLMIAWANMHGGHVLGQFSIVLFVFMESVKYLHPSLQPLRPEVFRKVLIAGVCGIVFSLINPNTYHALDQFLNTDREFAGMIANNLEYASSIERYSMGGRDILIYWLFCLLGLIGIILTIRRPDITRIAFLAATGYFSFAAIRYIPFYLIVALPFIGKALSGKSILKYARIALVFLAVSAAAYFAWNERLNVFRVTRGNWISTYEMPVGAADFILQNDVKGNMFNFSDWGGYLLWRLGPERKVFTDGRFLYPETYFIESGVGAAASNNYFGLPYWKSVLSGYGVSYIIMPLFVAYGETYPLLFELVKDSDWLPVYFAQKAIVFVRNSPENRQVMEAHAIPKNLFIDMLVEECDLLIRARPYEFKYYMAKSDLNVFRGNVAGAKEGYEKVLELAPDFTLARQKLRAIELNTH